MAQLRSEQQKNQSKNNEEHQEQSESHEEHEKSKNEPYKPTVSRVPGMKTTMPTKNNVSFTKSTPGAMKKDVTSISSATTYSDENENENHNEYQSPIVRIPQSDSKTSLSRKISTKTGKSSNDPVATAGKNSHVTVALVGKNSDDNVATPGKNSNDNVVTAGKNSKLDSFTTLNGIHVDSSQISSYPLLSSSINVRSRSDILDQDFHLDDPNDHARRNDTKRHGKIVISGPEK